MKFAATEIVRQAIAYAILDAIQLWVDPKDIPCRAYGETMERYSPVFDSQADDIAQDVQDWFIANGPYSGDITTLQRRLMLALWQPERFN